jgi:hypothetical protein
MDIAEILLLVVRTGACQFDLAEIPQSRRGFAIQAFAAAMREALLDGADRIRVYRQRFGWTPPDSPLTHGSQSFPFEDARVWVAGLCQEDPRFAGMFQATIEHDNRLELVLAPCDPLTRAELAAAGSAIMVAYRAAGFPAKLEWNDPLVMDEIDKLVALARSRVPV